MDFDLDKLAQVIREFGIGGAIVIVFAVGVAFNLPGIIKEFREAIEVILAYRLASRRLQEEIRKSKEDTTKLIENELRKRGH